MGVSPHGNTERSGKSEISELEIVMTVDEQILRLEISVEDPVRMTVKQTRVQLISEFLK